MSKYRGGGTSVWQVVGGIFLGLIILVFVGLAGYGTYALVDKYALPKDTTPEQTETTPGEDKEVATSAEYVLADAAVQDIAA